VNFERGPALGVHQPEGVHPEALHELEVSARMARSDMIHISM
jgi:hypothetical protein